MTGHDLAADALKSGDPASALAHLQDAVRARPEDGKLRVFLFQLLCVLGQWDRALKQLTVAANLDPAALVMAQMYGDAIRCEAVRREVFEGRKSPVIFGQPEPWLAYLSEALVEGGRGAAARAEELRTRAFEEAPASGGAINDERFEWVADADARLGPVLEAIVNGRYYWLPFSRLRRLTMEAPEDLRDLVWMPARLELQNGGEALALVPARYPGSEASADGLIALARKTVWGGDGANEGHGLGQRLLTTDVNETGMLDIRTLAVDASAAEAA